MVHQPSGGFQGQATDIMLHAQEILNLKKRLNEIYVKHTGQTYKAIEDALERDKFLTADMARDFGIVDKVIEQASRRSVPGEADLRRNPGQGDGITIPRIDLNGWLTRQVWRASATHAPQRGQSSAATAGWRRGNRATLGRFRRVLPVPKP